MTDTQWPRYQVFVQERAGEPHQDAGSVHAPDGEMALQNARDVFVRRPSCVSLWVAPAASILAKTDQELRQEPALHSAAEPKDGQPAETYYVFWKTKSAGTHTLAGEVRAETPAAALAQAVKQYGEQSRRPPFVWWVLPARVVIKTAPEEAESLFAPAEDKPFRLSTHFRTVSAMREIKKDKKEVPGGTER